MKIISLKVDADLIETGTWVDNIPELGDVRFKVRGLNNAAYRRLQSKLLDSLPRAKRVGGRIDPEDQDRITAKCLHQTVLLDWDGIDGENDEPLPYDKDTAWDFLSKPEYRRIRDGVVWAANTVGEQAVDDLEADAKNSSPPSGGNTDGAASQSTSNG